MYPLYSIPLFLSSALIAGGAIAVLLKNSHKSLTRQFSYLAFSVALWLFGYGLVYMASDVKTMLFAARLGYIGVVFIPTLFCQFVFAFLRQPHRKSLMLCYSLSFVF